MKEKPNLQEIAEVTRNPGLLDKKLSKLGLKQGDFLKILDVRKVSYPDLAKAVVEHPDIALRNFEEQMKKEKKKTKKRVMKLTRHLDDLSQQQMEVLTSAQERLMSFRSFREDAEESQLQAAEMQAAELDMFDT